MDRLLRLRDVIDKTGLGKSTLYRKIAAGEFPRQVSVGGASVRWRESAVNAWIGSLAPRDDVRLPCAPAAGLR